MELSKAIEKGYRVKPITGYVFKTGNPLKSYSEFFRNIKDQAQKDGDMTLRSITKLFLNRLYGKFGSSYFLDTTTITRAEGADAIRSLYKVNSILNLDKDIKIVSHRIKPNKDSNVSDDTLNRAFKKLSINTLDKTTNIAIAAAITSYGRLILYNLYEEVSNKEGVLCYSDTDSIFASF